MERAIARLAQLSEADLHQEIAVGLGHVLKNVHRLLDAATYLKDQEKSHGSRILGRLADEEAAKVFILIDAIRCPAQNKIARSRTLSYFYDHLAKAIYGEVYGWRPVNFAEVATGIELERSEYYLDGPFGTDWIFPNRLMQAREDDLYVGYVIDDSEEAGQGSCTWTEPYDEPALAYLISTIVQVAQAMETVGATTQQGLKIISDVWMTKLLTPDSEYRLFESANREVLELMDRHGILNHDPSAISTVIKYWSFPLWPLDLRKRRMNKDELREVRRNAVVE